MKCVLRRDTDRQTDSDLGLYLTCRLDTHLVEARWLVCPIGRDAHIPPTSPGAKAARANASVRPFAPMSRHMFRQSPSRRSSPSPYTRTLAHSYTRTLAHSHTRTFARSHTPVHSHSGLPYSRTLVFICLCLTSYFPVARLVQ